MKRMMIVLAILLFASSVSAQEIEVGVKAGYNASYMTGLSQMFAAMNNMDGVDAVDGSTSIRSGVHAGLMMQMGLTQLLFLQPELLYSMQGVKLDGSITAEGQLFTQKTTTTLHYLQLPVYFGCKFNPEAESNIIMALGPYVACGLGGSEKDKDSGLAQDMFGEHGFFKRIDVGLSFLVGTQLFNKMQLSVACDLGLIDVVDVQGWKTAKDLLGLSSVCNRNFKISLAYFF